jgi:cytochrome P450
MSSITTSLNDLPITHGRLADFPADPIRTMRTLHAQHGNLAVLEEADARIIFGFGHEYNHRVLNDTNTFHSQFFAVRGPKHSAQRRLTCGILSMNGEQHKRQRRLVHPPFQKKAIASYHRMIEQLVETQIEQWQFGQIRNIHKDSVELLLHITSAILFGVDQRSLALQIGQATERWVELNHLNGLGSLLSTSRDPKLYDELLQQATVLEGLIQQLINERRRTGNPQANDVLNLLIHAHDEEGNSLSDEELIGQAAVLFGAAHLTTANSLSWTLFLLAQHPQVGYQLLEELEPFQGRAPGLMQLEQLPYLDAVIKESMRCLPASAYSQRVCYEPVQLGPLQVRRGDLLIFSQYITHHLPELFADADRFVPERWDSIKPSPYEYLPFASGPRMCIGASLASMILRIAVPLIWQRYRLTLVPGATVDGIVTSTMLGPKKGIPMLIGSEQALLANHWVRGNIHDLVKLDWPESPKSILGVAA